LLVAAAEAHDLGKDRALWQNAMNARRDDGRPYAKTQGGGDGRALNGYRHEFGSLRDVLAAPESYLPAAVADHPDRLDLALHLILAHHGWARPSIKAYDPDQLPSRSPALAREAALRFAKLQFLWGPWGLAWWESLLRAADWAASRALNEQDDTSPEALSPMEPANG
jgi:CRISPR-associated endonuclease/helicase Cas3